MGPGLCADALRECLPRMLGQIDRDPDSPTFGSCDRNFWMYRIHDFESGVLRQAALPLVVAAGLPGCAPALAQHLRDSARAINRRNASALADTGLFDEYFPGERSYPGTVFAAYATLRSACELGQDAVVDSTGLQRCAEALFEREPGPAANQDVAAAAFLALYARETGWRTEDVNRRAAQLVAGPEGHRHFLEYGGVDLGYASVSLHYLAMLHLDGTLDVADTVVELAERLSDFITPAGQFGGEFASRSTTYWLPLGFLVAAELEPALAHRVARLDLAAMLARLDDRYLMHYCSPSLALAATREVVRGESGPARNPSQVIDLRAFGLWGVRDDAAAVACFIGLNKGGTFHLECAGKTHMDLGYRIEREDGVYATSVLSELGEAHVSGTGAQWRIDIVAPFMRYRSLTASPAKTVALRGLQALGPQLNRYFRQRLIMDAQALPDVHLHRTLFIDRAAGSLRVVDKISGQRSTDVLCVAPPVGLRLVPSARFWQAGEAEASVAAGTLEVERCEREFQWVPGRAD